MFASILGVYYPCNNFLYAEHILQCNDQTMGFYAYYILGYFASIKKDLITL